MDQTIEKVSFCAPDRNLDKAFSYICRDGTTRRWICHCFLALKDSVSATARAVLSPLPLWSGLPSASWPSCTDPKGRWSISLCPEGGVLTAASRELVCEMVMG